MRNTSANVCLFSLQVVSLLLEREPTIILEPKPDSPCPPLVQTQPPRNEISMETTLSGRAKDYSFVTDGERKQQGTHMLAITSDSVRHTHTCTTHTSPEVTVSHLTATLCLLSETSRADAASVPWSHAVWNVEAACLLPVLRHLSPPQQPFLYCKWHDANFLETSKCGFVIFNVFAKCDTRESSKVM